MKPNNIVVPLEVTTVVYIELRNKRICNYYNNHKLICCLDSVHPEIGGI